MSMQETIHHIIQRGKGILAADESNQTMGKRLASINLSNEAHYRQQFRSLLATSPDIGEYISGVILFEETFHQHTDEGESIVNVFKKNGVIPGIKVDKGLTTLAGTNEKITRGLDSLEETLKSYQSLGAQFAKWRAVFSVSEVLPSMHAIHANANALARYAAECQAQNIVPIVEPEVLMNGDHTLERCAEVTEAVLNEVFLELKKHSVSLENMILKPNMVISGDACKTPADSKEIAEATLSVFKRTVPAAVPSINFLSGGQSETEATMNLKAINHNQTLPWNMSFSYGRALQASTLEAWSGDQQNLSDAQAAFINRAKLNSLASMGE